MIDGVLKGVVAACLNGFVLLDVGTPVKMWLLLYILNTK